MRGEWSCPATASPEAPGLAPRSAGWLLPSPMASALDTPRSLLPSPPLCSSQEPLEFPTVSGWPRAPLCQWPFSEHTGIRQPSRLSQLPPPPGHPAPALSWSMASSAHKSGQPHSREGASRGMASTEWGGDRCTGGQGEKQGSRPGQEKSQAQNGQNSVQVTALCLNCCVTLWEPLNLFGCHTGC